MDEISIKINISDRVYPMRISVEEEELVRKAAKDINEHIKNLQINYNVRDKQDLLSMCLLHYATIALKFDGKQIIEDHGITKQIDHLDSLLKDILEDKK